MFEPWFSPLGGMAGSMGGSEIVEVMVRDKRKRMVEGYRCSVSRVWGFTGSV